jgi:streptomycin 6-kinase
VRANLTANEMTDSSAALEHYLTAWGLSKPRPLAQTPTSTVYLVTLDHVEVVLKILSPYGVEERTGAVALRHFDGNGAVRLLRSDDHAHLMEYAPGEEVAEWVRNGQDEPATEIIAHVINALHANHGTRPDGILTLRGWFRPLLAKAESDRDSGLETIYTRAGRLANTVLDEPREPRVLHGDIHHRNIRQSSRGWLAFDPKGLYGERTYDLANALCNPPPGYGVSVTDETRILRNSEILARRCGIEPSRVLTFLFLYACLSASAMLEGSEGGWDIPTFIRIAEIAECHL